MGIAEAFANIALGFSQAFGTGYYDGIVRWPGTPVREGGSIVSPGMPVEASCSVQVDEATERMRLIPGYTDKDVALLILAATLDGNMNTDARVVVSAGPHAGTYTVDWVNRDPAAIYWLCRGRKA